MRSVQKQSPQRNGPANSKPMIGGRKFLRRSLDDETITFESQEDEPIDDEVALITDGEATVGGFKCHYILDDGCTNATVPEKFAQQLEMCGITTIREKVKPEVATLANFAKTQMTQEFKVDKIMVNTMVGHTTLKTSYRQTPTRKSSSLGRNNAWNWVWYQ